MHTWAAASRDGTLENANDQFSLLPLRPMFARTDLGKLMIIAMWVQDFNVLYTRCSTEHMRAPGASPLASIINAHYYRQNKISCISSLLVNKTRLSVESLL